LELPGPSGRQTAALKKKNGKEKTEASKKDKGTKQKE
jgi:hypothetical protein